MLHKILPTIARELSISRPWEAWATGCKRIAFACRLLPSLYRDHQVKASPIILLNKFWMETRSGWCTPTHSSISSTPTYNVMPLGESLPI